VGGGEPVEGAGEAAGLTPPPRSYEAPPARSYDAPPPRSYENPPPRSYEAPRPGHPAELGPPRSRREPEADDLKLRDLVAYLARGLVDHPDDVAVEILEPGDDAAFELRVHPDDLGHVIGKQGRTARSLRLALGAAAGRIGRRASLEIAD